MPNEEEEKALEEVRREQGVESKAKNNGVVNRAVMKVRLVSSRAKRQLQQLLPPFN